MVMSMNGNGNRNVHHHRRGHSFNGIPNFNSDHHNSLHLFSNSRCTHSFASFNDVSVKLGRLFAESERLATSGIDDLLLSTEGGKHDYDWLLTPPGTPDSPLSESKPQPILAPSRSSLGRLTSNANTSRLLASQSENRNQFRPERNSSVTRSSISTLKHSSSSSSNYSSNRISSILNTSSASVPSYTRPSSPIARSPSSVARPSTPTSRAMPSSKVPTTSSVDIKRSPRPSTPRSNSGPHIPANILHSPPTWSFSRPSTPTHRHSMPSPSPTTLTSAGRGASNGRNLAPMSRPSFPSRRPQPIVPPDFPLETPPNLRTTLPDRPVSAGRCRPGAATLKASSETQASANMSRRQPSLIVNRGRLPESIGKGCGHAIANANGNGHHELRRVPHAPEAVAWRSLKASATAPDSNGLGRTISKKSLDTAAHGTAGTLRSLSSATLFPQSIQTSAPKTQLRGLSAPALVDMNGGLQSRNNGACLYIGNDINGMNGKEIDEKPHNAKLSEVDIYESSRYDSLLLKNEDLKNTDWLHSADDKCDQGPIFDNGFESLPELFGLLYH